MECQKIFEVVTTELSYTLGSETTDLKLRCGLHSGPVTDGVIRGLRSRFEIFGNTVNTVSRMESTGIPTIIQLSQATIDLLIKSGKKVGLSRETDALLPRARGRCRCIG